MKLLIRMVFYEPSATLSEYANEFNKRYPMMQVNSNSVCRFFKARGINRKQVTFLAVIAHYSSHMRQSNVILFSGMLINVDCHNIALTNSYSSMNLASTSIWDIKNMDIQRGDKKSFTRSFQGDLRILACCQQ